MKTFYGMLAILIFTAGYFVGFFIGIQAGMGRQRMLTQPVDNYGWVQNPPIDDGGIQK